MHKNLTVYKFSSILIPCVCKFKQSITQIARAEAPLQPLLCLLI